MDTIPFHKKLSINCLVTLYPRVKNYVVLYNIEAWRWSGNRLRSKEKRRGQIGSLTKKKSISTAFYQIIVYLAA